MWMYAIHPQILEIYVSLYMNVHIHVTLHVSERVHVTYSVFVVKKNVHINQPSFFSAI